MLHMIDIKRIATLRSQITILILIFQIQPPQTPYIYIIYISIEEIAKGKNGADLPRKYVSPDPSEINLSNVDLSMISHEQGLPPAKDISSDPSIMDMQGIDIDLSTSRSQELDLAAKDVSPDPSIMNMNDIDISMNRAARNNHDHGHNRNKNVPQKEISPDPSLMNMDAVDISLNRTESMEREIDAFRMSRSPPGSPPLLRSMGSSDIPLSPLGPKVYIYIYIYIYTL